LYKGESDTTALDVEDHRLHREQAGVPYPVCDVTPACGVKGGRGTRLSKVTGTIFWQCEVVDVQQRYASHLLTVSN
jgi:hypothetical protein